MTHHQPIRVALFGLGRMGVNHLRVLQENDACKIAFIFDPAFGPDCSPPIETVPCIANPEAIYQFEFDCAIIASPTSSHLEMGKKLTQLAKFVLVEKPLCCTAAESAELVTHAAAQGCNLFAGHVERFNPAIAKLKELLSSEALGKVIHLSFTRVGGYPTDFSKENNVLLDLAVHDLDILSQLVGPISIRSSVCHSNIRKDILDTAEILLSGDRGISASINCNWITPTKIRTVRITGTKGVCFIDYMLQTCSLWGGGPQNFPEKSGVSFAELIEAYKTGARTDFDVQQQEPLKLQLDALIQEIRGQKTELCTGEEAAYAVKLAEEAIASSVKFSID